MFPFYLQPPCVEHPALLPYRMRSMRILYLPTLRRICGRYRGVETVYKVRTDASRMALQPSFHSRPLLRQEKSRTSGGLLLYTLLHREQIFVNRYLLYATQRYHLIAWHTDSYTMLS